MGWSSSHMLSVGDLKLSEIIFKAIKKASLGACVHFLEAVSTLSYCKGDSTHKFSNFFFWPWSQSSTFENTFLWRLVQFGDGQRERNHSSTTFCWNENEENKQNNKGLSGPQRELFPLCQHLKFPFQTFLLLFQQRGQGQRVGRRSRKGRPSIVFPVSSWNCWDSSPHPPCGVCHMLLKYHQKYTHKSPRGDVAL